MFVSLGSAAENIEAAVDYLRETRGVKRGVHPCECDSAVPRGGGCGRAQGQEERDHSGAHRRSVVGDNPLGRDIRTALSKAIKTEGVRRPRDCRRSRSTKCRRSLAERTGWARAISVPSTSSARTSLPRRAARARTARRRPTGFRSSCWASTILIRWWRRDAFAAAGGRGCGALPLDWRMGRHHDGQEPGRDSRRLERSALRARRTEGRPWQSQGSDSRQRQSEVRIGEEGRADQLLYGGGQGSHSRELRPAPRDGGAVLRSQGVYAHQPAGRHGRGRQPGVGVGRGRRAGLGAAAAVGAQADYRQEHSRLHAAGLCHCEEGDGPRRLATAHAGQCVSGRVLCGEHHAAGVWHYAGAVPRGCLQAVCEKVRQAGRCGCAVEHGSDDAGLRAR